MVETPVKVTICVSCRYHVFDHEANPAAPRNTWYKHRCANENVVKATFDHVTGHADTEIPFCRDINVDGHCPFYRG
jgi:hypothetical protein